MEHSITTSDCVAVVASKKTWIEQLAIDQLTYTSSLPGMHYCVGMPDLHPGRTYPVGAAFFATEQIYPALIGNDIGCGMSLYQTSMPLRKAKLDKLAKSLKGVEQQCLKHLDEYIDAFKKDHQLHTSSFDHKLGTVGGGNHFAELQRVEEIYDAALYQALGLDKSCLQLLVHTGSRGFGQSILLAYQSQFQTQSLRCGTHEFNTYWQQHQQALAYAQLNRELVAEKFMLALKTKSEMLLDVHHNFIEKIEYKGITGYLHRKGATPSTQGVVMIPGSRGDFSYLIQPLDAEKSLFSLAHGAGRKWKRGACKARLDQRYSMQDLQTTSLGSRVICQDKTLIYDEAPEAYKSCAQIIEDMVDAKLIRVIAKFRPVMTYKTEGSCGS